MFLPKLYLILNWHECNSLVQIMHFPKSVLHLFMLFMSAFQKRTSPDWTCTSSKNSSTPIEFIYTLSRHHPYFFLKSAALLEERQMSRRTMYFLHENGMQSWNMHLRVAVSWAFFQKILHLEHNLTFCSCFCEHEQIHVHVWKIDSMLCTIAAFAKDKMGFRLSWTKNGCMLQYTPC